MDFTRLVTITFHLYQINMRKTSINFIRIVRRFTTDQQGFSLIELVISLALISVLGVTLMQGLSTVARGQGVHDERVGSMIAGRTHLESIKQAAYDLTVTSTPGPGYSSLPAQITVGDIIFDMEIIAREIETGAQLVTVVVSNGGNEINRLQTYKADR